MPRPARYSVDDLLDAGVALLAADGPAAVSMSAVARAVGAPSGSVYHRFPTRAALCGELWVRTEERFQDGYLAALGGPGDVTDRCLSAGWYMIRFCRDSPDEAQVLFAGADALGRADWPDDVRRRRDALSRSLKRALGGLQGNPDRLHAALVGVPYGVVRRYLLVRAPIPRSADVIVEDCIRALVG